MNQLPAPNTEQLRTRYPDVFNRPVSARLATSAMILGAFGILIFGLVDLDFSASRFLAGLNQLGWITMLMIPPDPGSSLPAYMVALGETLSIALLGTTIAAFFALPVSLLAARNIVPSNFFRFPVRRFLDSIRGVDTLIWALVWINVVGLGPFAGVLAIAVADFGAFGKLFSEAIEAADQKQVEGIRASGGSALHEIRFGLLPQVLPVIAGQVLYFIESNTRSATIIGIVGAGGREPRGQLIDASEEAATRELARELGLKTGTPLIRIESVRLADRAPICVSTTWLSAQRFPGAGSVFANARSMTKLLAHYGIRDYRRASTRITAAIADATDAARLDLALGRPVLVVDSTDFGPDNRPLLTKRSRFAAERVEFLVEDT